MMIGVFLGVIGGALELFLLTRMVKSVTNGTVGKTALLLLLKFLVLAASFTAVILIRRSELLWCAVGMTGVLIVGSILLFLMRQSRSKGGK
ncbi:MAG: hypothetical protein AAGU74_13445 [Bacillota bacterium]